MDAYLSAYKGLNAEQKKAVDTIEGPVMVVAGPGTGKTQVLAVRIAHILTKTDTPPDGVLCLTFTNAGVKAMQERLVRYIGSAATRVRISTFHSFGMALLEKFYPVLGFHKAPTLLDDAASVALLDDVFQHGEWQYLRPRNNPGMFAKDITSLISLLKRERITAEDFRHSIANDIERLKKDPSSISTRGESKGQLKKDVEKKIEGLERTLEVADFYERYENHKHERGYIDYNDVLEYMVRLVTISDEARDYVREQYLYILIDEHQDSTGVQNEFLEAVWKNTDSPNIFVVGDDRQLIYGFGGASLAYFEGFKHAFGKATLITLTQNYRSTQTILDCAENLLQSSLAEGKLVGNTEVSHPVTLIEAEYPRDEILAAGIAIKAYVESGGLIDDCAILVPKNRQVKAAATILTDMGLKVAAQHTVSLFELEDTQFFLKILQIVHNPFNSVALSHTVLHSASGVPMMTAHQFLRQSDLYTLSIENLTTSSFAEVRAWGEKLLSYVTQAQHESVYSLLQYIGSDLLLERAPSDAVLRRRVEIIRTMLNLVTSHMEQGNDVTLESFLAFIDRLIAYDEDIPLALFSKNTGIKILTLHGSKGLEFDFVWVAHMDERSLMATRRQAFTLPEDILEKIEERDEEVAKRQLYVAMTRAKRKLTISYALLSHTGVDQKLASIIATLPEGLLNRMSASQTEEAILAVDPKQFVTRLPLEEDDTEALIESVSREYVDRPVSVTLLNNFFECPWKWYFRNLLQLPEPMSESIHVGNVVHKSIEYFLNGGTQLDERIETCADAEAFRDKVLAKRLATEAKRILKTWVENYAGSIQQPFEIERSLSYKDPSMPELKLYGKIDVVEELSPGSVRVTDWKTGSLKTKADIERVDEEGRMSSYLRQLAMYAYLIEGTSSGTKSIDEARLVFVEASKDKQAVVSRKITSEDIHRLREDITEYRHSIESGEWIKRSCTAATYGTSDGCAYCNLAHKYSGFGRISKEK